jgi:hypothetical protein
MTFNKIIWRRGRFIGPQWIFRSPDEKVKSFIATNQRETEGK